MDEGTKFSFLTSLPFLAILLARVGLILIRMVESLKSCVRELAVFLASDSSLWVVVFALFRKIIELIRWSSVVKGLMCIHTMVPIMVLRLISTEGGLVSIDVEDNGVNGL